MAKSFPLRLPDELKEQLERAAKTDHRSLNAEIIWRLEQSLKGRSDG